jgi:5'-phosphate synthase pdxT subunit
MPKSQLAGILGLQGDFARHQRNVEELGVPTRIVRNSADLEPCTHLIIPGGESTTIQKLLDFTGLRQPLIDFGRSRPVWGTCAGMILLAREVDDPRQTPLNLIDIAVRRNAYGRQIASFTTDMSLPFLGNGTPFHAVFIRAPIMESHGPDVTPLADVDGRTVLARQGRVLVSSFHPELTRDLRLHEYFLNF